MEIQADIEGSIKVRKDLCEPILRSERAVGTMNQRSIGRGVNRRRVFLTTMGRKISIERGLNSFLRASEEASCSGEEAIARHFNSEEK
jgi:hypothetical protein